MANILPGSSTEDRRSKQIIRNGKGPKVSPWKGILGEYAGTFLTETAVMVSQILVYKLAAYLLGKNGFSEYAVARRAIALIYPCVLLGLTVALPRFIARNQHENNGSGSKGYFGAALWCVVCMAAVLFGTASLLRVRVALLFFGSSEFARDIAPLSLCFAALALHTVTYAYFRGHLAMKLANTLQGVNLGLIPLLVFLIQRESVRAILMDLGALTLMITGIAILVFTPWREGLSVQRRKVEELLRYGMQRLPGDLCLLGLFTLPTVVTAHAQGVQQAGLVAFGMLILTITAALVNPLGLILLPKASRMFVSGASSELRGHVLRLLKVIALLSGSFSIAAAALAMPLIRIYLGPDFVGAAAVIRLVALGVVPYCLFLLLSHVIDAFHRNSVTAGIEIIAFIAACVGCTVAWSSGRSVNGFLLAFLGGLFTLALLSSLVCLGIFRKGISSLEESGEDIAAVVGVPGE